MKVFTEENLLGWMMELPVGTISVIANDEAIVGLYFESLQPNIKLEKTPLLAEAERQLDQYFRGKRKSFELPLFYAGTQFQESVWEALLTIPYGETRSYGAIAQQIGNPKAPRAVGLANNRNPIAIIIPCHRVIGADGSLVGFGGGLDFKRFLLDLEQKWR